MPRPRRHHVSGGVYHVTLRGNHREGIFRGPDDYRMLERMVELAVEDYGLRVHAYCWMPNHIHLAVEVSHTPLGRPMARIASGYARNFQRLLATTGHLFERRYHAVLVDSDRYLFSLVRYIHQNPVRAKLVKEPATFPWSSHRAYLGGRFVSWLTTDNVLGKLSADRARARVEYLRLMASQPSAEELRLLREGVPDDGDGEVARPTQLPVTPHEARPSFDTLMARVCADFGTEPATLAGMRRGPTLTVARGAVALLALKTGTCSLTESARRLRRAPATISEAIATLRERRPDWIEAAGFRKETPFRKPGTK